MIASNRNVIILSLALIVVSLGFGMVIPIFPFYIEHFGGGGKELGLLVAVAALTELIFGPVWGSLSDRVGRKPILMLGMLGYGVSSLLFGLATELWMLYAARALSGVLSAATASTAMAYIGDSTSDEDRGGGMGTLGAAAGLGVVFGPGIGGGLAGSECAWQLARRGVPVTLREMKPHRRSPGNRLPLETPRTGRNMLAEARPGSGDPRWLQTRRFLVMSLYKKLFGGFAAAALVAAFSPAAPGGRARRAPGCVQWACPGPGPLRRQ